MNGSEEITNQGQTSRGPCLVDGCSCKDARIVSRRKTAYFAAMARAAGQTADRVIAPQRGWRIPSVKPAETVG
jgi:hypothetical protein